jgi:hypothetical protein
VTGGSPPTTGKVDLGGPGAAPPTVGPLGTTATGGPAGGVTGKVVPGGPGVVPSNTGTKGTGTDNTQKGTDTNNAQSSNTPATTANNGNLPPTTGTPPLTAGTLANGTAPKPGANSIAPQSATNAPPGFHNGLQQPDGSGGVITYYDQNGHWTAVDCFSGGGCGPSIPINFQQLSNGTWSWTASNGLTTLSGIIGTPTVTSGLQDVQTAGTAAGTGSDRQPIYTNAIYGMPGVRSYWDTVPDDVSANYGPLSEASSLPTPTGSPAQPDDTSPGGDNPQQQDQANNAPPPDDSQQANNNNSPDSDTGGSDNGGCSPDPCFKSAFNNPEDMTPEQMQAQVNQNRMMINDQRLQAIDGESVGVQPVCPECMFLPAAPAAQFIETQINNPNTSVWPTVAAETTKDVLSLEAIATGVGNAVGAAANRVPIIGPAISGPAARLTTWAINQTGGAIIDAGADHFFSTNPNSE